MIKWGYGNDKVRICEWWSEDMGIIKLGNGNDKVRKCEW